MKLKGISLFSNVGIGELLLKDLNIEIILANEIIKNRAKFYKENYTRSKIINDDITKKDVKENVINFAKENSIDFIIATPPCQGMSSAGKNLRDDPRNLLITHTIEIIKKTKPKFIFLENVPQQLKTSITFRNKRILITDYIYQLLKSDYIFNEKLIYDMSHYNVPQQRKRSIFMLVRKDLNFEWKINFSNNKLITLSDSIGQLPSLDPLIYDISFENHLKIFPNYMKKIEQGKKISKWHYPPSHPLRQVLVMQNTPSGKSAFQNQNKKYQPRKTNGELVKGFKNTYKRQSWDKPGSTITCYNRTIGSQENVHPGRRYKSRDNKVLYSDPRVLSIYELMIIMSIPNNWKIPSWASDGFIRQVIGEGIPPKALKIFFKELLNYIK